jgi:aminoglycoside phosphotransferase (APT) family kinase protein
MAKRKAPPDLSEPQLEDEDWTWWGGEPVLAMGSTEGGCPYGLSMTDYREASERDSPRAGWAVAKAVLRQALSERGVDPTDRDAIDWVNYLGQGCTYRTWRATCSWPDAGPGGEAELVVRLPIPPASADQPEKARRELELLSRLAELQPPWRLSEPVACVPVESGLAQVQHLVPGAPLEMRASRSRVRPWEVIAQVASACHNLDPARFADLFPPTATRRRHAESAIEVLLRSDLPEFQDAHAWALETLPPETPARLLHGDLLGQNLHLDVLGDGPVGVLDWSEARLGDPAYDLAVVTRGVRRPFQVDRGLQTLLEAYNAQVPEPVTAQQVHLHELCLVAGWYLADREQGRGKAHLQAHLTRLRGVLGRAASSG